MAHDSRLEAILKPLNPAQRAAASHGEEPLLIVAGAGTGKTATLVHRVAWLIAQGTPPERILLLTFTRRAAAEMLRRVENVMRHFGESPAGAAEDAGVQRRAAPAELAQTRSRRRAHGPARVRTSAPTPREATTGAWTTGEPPTDPYGDEPFTKDGLADALPSHPSALAASGTVASRSVWGGTFHAVATRLLRRYGRLIGLPPDFSVHDRGDSEDLMQVVRTELGLGKKDQRFPKKGTCAAIYSRLVNAREALDDALQRHFPWCVPYRDDLKRLFDAYVDRKQAAGVLDYDDLLVHWLALLEDERGGQVVRGLFDRVLVDEYQDTNVLQAEIIRGLCPDGRGLTVVGDDAQAIYAFRAATVRNILDFPKQFPGARIIALEQNYRSTMPILQLANAVMSQAREAHRKRLWSQRTEGAKPQLVDCFDEDEQTVEVIRRILDHHEAGIPLRRQAVLFRASHHSMALEAELVRRHIPFHKYGGLKFVEAAHIKDLLAILRLAENPRDVVSGVRLLALLPGIGPTTARRLMAQLEASSGNFEPWGAWKAPAACAETWSKLVKLMKSLRAARDDLPAQVHRARLFYAPLLETNYDNAAPRLRDLEQLERIASRYRSRQRMLVELTLDPPSSTEDLAGPPRLDDDYLVLSTMHSAKGLEWDAVYILHAADGNIPSDMATRHPEEIEEERRLFYVAMTRAKSWLYIFYTENYYFHPSSASDAHGMAQLTRFLPKSTWQRLDRVESRMLDDDAPCAAAPPGVRGRRSSDAARRRMRDLWR